MLFRSFSTKRYYHLSCFIPDDHTHASLLSFREHGPVNVHFIASRQRWVPFYRLVLFCGGSWTFIRYLKFLQQAKRAFCHCQSTPLLAPMSCFILIFPYPPANHDWSLQNSWPCLLPLLKKPYHVQIDPRWLNSKREGELA